MQFQASGLSQSRMRVNTRERRFKRWLLVRAPLHMTRGTWKSPIVQVTLPAFVDLRLYGAGRRTGR
jgi:hypothetical protein